MSLPLCVLALSLGTAVGAARGSCRCASALTVLAGVWVLGNGAVEGPVLWTFDSDHGLTTADLLVIPMLALGLRCLARSREVRNWLVVARALGPEQGQRRRIRSQRVALTRLIGRRSLVVSSVTNGGASGSGDARPVRGRPVGQSWTAGASVGRRRH